MQKYGAERAKAIELRLHFLKAAPSLATVPPHPPQRRHQLSGDRKEQFAVDIKHPYRLVFAPNHNPLPQKADGGIDLGQITAIIILNVEDYHK